MENQDSKQSDSESCVVSDVAAVSIQSRLLPFWREYPRAWFIQFESVVDIRKTPDDQKYKYLLQQLQTSDLRHITDLLYSPPAINKYDSLKQRLLSVYEQSEVKNFQQLISGLELGDEKPSQLLRRMKELAGNMITEEGLKIEWLNHMPQQIRVVLSVNTDSSLENLAKMADKMLEYTQPANVIASLSATAPAHTSRSTARCATCAPTEQRAAPGLAAAPATATLESLAIQMQQLSMEIAELRVRTAPRYRHPFRTRSRSRSAYRDNKCKPGDANWICKYHRRFGDKARRCESPCSRRTKMPEN